MKTNCIQNKKKHVDKTLGSFKIRVFSSSSSKELNTPFCDAFNKFKSNNGDYFVVQFVDGFAAKCNNWSPADLVNWLLDCDCHFILTHIHQGKFIFTYFNSLIVIF